MVIKIAKPNKPFDSKQFLTLTGFSLFIENDDYFISGDATEAELLSAWNSYEYSAPLEPTIEDKLISVGLTIEDLKAALGL